MFGYVYVIKDKFNKVKSEKLYTNVHDATGDYELSKDDFIVEYALTKTQVKYDWNGEKVLYHEKR